MPAWVPTVTTHATATTTRLPRSAARRPPLAGKVAVAIAEDLSPMGNKNNGHRTRSNPWIWSDSALCDRGIRGRHGGCVSRPHTHPPRLPPAAPQPLLEQDTPYWLVAPIRTRVDPLISGCIVWLFILFSTASSHRAFSSALGPFAPVRAWRG